MILPSLTKHISSEMSVWYIQKLTALVGRKRKTIPQSSGKEVRYIRPRAISASVEATSSLTTLPVPNVTVGMSAKASFVQMSVVHEVNKIAQSSKRSVKILLPGDRRS